MYFNIIDWDMGLHKKRKKKSGNADLEEKKSHYFEMKYSLM